jgi:hypothetical protein
MFLFTWFRGIFSSKEAIVPAIELDEETKERSRCQADLIASMSCASVLGDSVVDSKGVEHTLTKRPFLNERIEPEGDPMMQSILKAAMSAENGVMGSVEDGVLTIENIQQGKDHD